METRLALWCFILNPKTKEKYSLGIKTTKSTTYKIFISGILQSKAPK